MILNMCYIKLIENIVLGLYYCDKTDKPERPNSTHYTHWNPELFSSIL